MSAPSSPCVLVVADPGRIGELAAALAEPLPQGEVDVADQHRRRRHDRSVPRAHAAGRRDHREPRARRRDVADRDAARHGAARRGRDRAWSATTPARSARALDAMELAPGSVRDAAAAPTRRCGSRSQSASRRSRCAPRGRPVAPPRRRSRHGRRPVREPAMSTTIRRAATRREPRCARAGRRSPTRSATTTSRDGDRRAELRRSRAAAAADR